MPRQLSPADPAFLAVSAFIEAHHQKANRGDLNALVNDYADQVLVDKGVVDKAYIYKNETLSRSSFQQMAERIIYPISIQQIGSNQYQAQYQIAWDAIKKDGRRSNGTSTVTLTLEGPPGGLKIVTHISGPENDV